jgi:hypothetical protein
MLFAAHVTRLHLGIAMRWMTRLAPGVIAIAAGCGPAPAPSVKQENSIINTASGSIASVRDPVPPALAASPDLVTMKKRFVFDPDRIRGGGVYIPRSQTSGNSFSRSYLGAEVMDDGDVALESHYAGHAGISHTRVRAKVGSQVIETADVPANDPMNRRYSSSGLVWEAITFVHGRDNGLLEAIATHPNAPVRIRMIGEKIKEFILSARDKNAIRDSYELAHLLRP